MNDVNDYVKNRVLLLRERFETIHSTENEIVLHRYPDGILAMEITAWLEYAEPHKQKFIRIIGNTAIELAFEFGKAMQIEWSVKAVDAPDSLIFVGNNPPPKARFAMPSSVEKRILTKLESIAAEIQQTRKLQREVLHQWKTCHEESCRYQPKNKAFCDGMFKGCYWKIPAIITDDLSVDEINALIAETPF